MKNIDELIEGLKCKECKKREKSFKEILKISEKNPELLYPKWGVFLEHLSSNNVFWMYQAVYIIANLTKVDNNKFEKIFDSYFNLLNDKSIVVAAHAALNAGKIAKNRPKLEPKITERLLATEKSRHKHKGIIQAYAMEAFSEYFKDAKDKKNIIKFSEKQFKVGNPKAKKAAKEILNLQYNLK